MSTALQRRIWYRDAAGDLQSVLVESTTADEIERMERQYRRAEARWREQHRTFTDLGGKPRADKPVPQAPEGSAWEGPRLSFASYIGEGRIWWGRPAKYQWCKGRKLERWEYCLDCDRCGRELEIEGPGEQVKRKVHRPGKLKGGKG